MSNSRDIIPDLIINKPFKLILLLGAMVIKYSRLNSGDNTLVNFYKWTAARFPVAFFKQQILLVGLVIVSFLLFIITTFFTSDVRYDLIQSSTGDTNYGVVIDCGSSGSRAHIFIWNKNDRAPSIELLRDELNQRPLNKHITPGISFFKDNPEKVSDYMEPIMRFLSETIPQDRHEDTPVSFLATAGLRLLDDATQKKILTTITSDLKLRYDFPNIKSHVITGEIEGIYSWLSLNSRKIYESSADIKSIGMIEVGGASTQVAFELSPEVENDILKNLDNNDAIKAFKNEQVRLNLGPDRSLKLFAVTFLGLGVNSARESLIDLLVRDNLESTGKWPSPSQLSNFEIQLNDPCLTIGSKEVVRRPTALFKSSQQSIGFVVRHQEQEFTARLHGSGNFQECYRLLERVLRVVKNERLNCLPEQRACAMQLLGTDFMPYNYYAFAGLSEMFFTTDAMMNSAGLFNRSHIFSETKRICATEYNKLLEIYSHREITYDDRILYECFKASWLLALLNEHGFRMPFNYDKFQTLDRLNGKEIDWTIGAMISEVSLGLKTTETVVATG